MILEQIQKTKREKTQTASNSEAAVNEQSTNAKLNKKEQLQSYSMYGAIVFLSVWFFWVIDDMPAIKWQLVSTYVIFMSILTLRLIDYKN